MNVTEKDSQPTGGFSGTPPFKPILRTCDRYTVTMTPGLDLGHVCKLYSKYTDSIADEHYNHLLEFDIFFNAFIRPISFNMDIWFAHM